jgi:signal peptidase II
MDPPRVIPITGFFNLVLGRNTGVSVGLLGEARPRVLVAFATAVIVVLIIWMSRAENRLTAGALGLIVGGAVGNVLDRLRHGVTDFLDFYVGQWHWPSFNMADVGIVCGAGLLLLESFLPGKQTEPSRT